MLTRVAVEDFSQPSCAGEGASDYERYLRTDELLRLQKRPEERAHHDELLFQTVHQSSELWLKLAAEETELAAGTSSAGELAAALRLLGRTHLCLRYVTAQLDMLERMSPWEYQEIRRVLGHGSRLRLARLPRAAPLGAGARPGAPRDPPRARARPADALRRGARARGALPARRGADRARRAQGVAHPALPGRRARDRRPGRRHAGDARRGARPAREAAALPRAVGGPERADRVREGVRLSAVVELLQELIRADTVNPPGNETRAAEVLRDYLEDAGVEVELIAMVPERANLVARIRGSGSGPTLALLSHTDTVLADPAEWQRDPWSGEVVDDEIWGRGALDMKGQVAASAVALASLAREGFRPNGDLVFIAAADEEVGEDFGLSWLVREHPEAVRADYAINEGGGDRVVLGGRPLYLCATAEKMSAPFRLRVRGRSGHASMPSIADNALVKAARIVEQLAVYRPRLRHLPETEALLEAILGEVPPVEEAAARAEAVHPMARTLVEPLLSLTFAPTMVEASKKRNVIPALCELVVDSRLQPGQTPEDPREELRAAIGEDGYEYELIEAIGGTAPRWRRRSGTRSRRSSPRRSRARPSPRSDAPASPTATGCGTRSARSRTASSRCGRWTPRWRRSSSTRRTSARTWTTSSSASAGCASQRSESAALSA